MIIAAGARRHGRELGWHREVIEQRAYEAMHHGLMFEEGTEVRAFGTDLRFEFRLRRGRHGIVLHSIRRVKS